MSGLESGSPFPLPLTPLEYYYFCDNRPDYPAAFPVELRFSGVLDREGFQRALAGTLARHPMLTARIELPDRGTPAWVDGDGSVPPLDWGREGTPICHADGPAIDLRTAPGLRIWVRESDDASRLLLQFHHACCDGLAALQFVEELLLSYHAELTRPRCDPGLRPLDVARLRHRGDLGVPPGWWGQMRDLWVGARFWSALALRQPAVLAAGEAGHGHAQTESPLLAFQSVDLDAGLTAALRRAAAAAGGTLHDVLLRDLFLGIHQWNLDHGGDLSRPIRINVPTSLRDRDDRLSPAANRLTFAFLSRRPRELRDPQRLLAGIAQQMQEIRKYRLGLYFVGGLGTFCRVPGLVPWFLRRRRSFATAVLSFAGRILAHNRLRRADGLLSCGNVVLERLTGVPPIRPLTRAAILAAIYGRRMTLSVRCDPQHFSPHDTQAFAQAYQQQLAATAGRSGFLA